MVSYNCHLQAMSLLWRFESFYGSHDRLFEISIQKFALFSIWQNHLQNVESVDFGDIVGGRFDIRHLNQGVYSSIREISIASDERQGGVW
jgi:hypothetical protein